MMSDNNKYMVFHAKDVERLAANDKSVRQLVDEQSLGDAVVIRKQDVFAASVLFQYANSVRTVSEILQAIDEDGFFNDDVESLNSIADYFAGEAIDSAYMDRKFPD